MILGMLSLPLRILNFLRDEVECVPAWVGEQSWVESQSYGSGIGWGPLERTLKAIYVSYRKKAKD